ncbi:SRPBCC domain-containing protein [Chitinophaga lutea]|uniref:SRPBCC domain-containing protein n=1 Tax=Chitinophaga lutea TaxID=2488634 RepID=A0A3N4PYF0_9BACT|nr:SRPBCC domain-containing protein [Chitinophaga lutea]RPE12936.1 SRPBCC domain-containing protein [Chitinophaga lutea]
MKNTDRSVHATREINAPVEAVWKALTDAQELERWFPLKASVNNGRIDLSWGGGVDWQMEIEEQQQNKYLRLGYNQDHHRMVSDVPRRLAVEFFLEAKDGKTLLRIVHAGFGGESGWDEIYDGVRRGWDTESLSLQHYLEHHAGKDRVVALAQINIKLPLQQVWNTLTKEGVSVKGDRYVYATPLGEVYEGQLVYLNPPQDLCGTLESLNNAMFRLTAERFMPDAGITIWVWIGAYGVPEAEVKALEQRWEQKLNELF